MNKLKRWLLWSFAALSQRWELSSFGLALLLRLVNLDRDRLWYDEAFTANIIRLDWSHMLAAMAGDVHPPLFYFIEWLVTRPLGISEISLRLPSVLFSSLAVVELGKLVKKTTGIQAGQIASLLLAIMPAQLNYGQEARSYALLTWLVLLAARQIIDHKSRWLWLIFSALIYTHYMSVLYLVVLAPLALIVFRHKFIRQIPIMIVCLLPLFPMLTMQVGNVASAYWIQPPSPGAISLALLTTTLYSRIPAFSAIHMQAGVVIASVIAVAALGGKWKQSTMLLLLAFAPPALLFTGSMIKPLWIDRLLIPAGAALVGVWAAGLVQLSLWSRVRLAALGVPLLLLAFIGYYIKPDNTIDYTTITDVIQRDWESCDVVYHMDTGSYILASYYWPDKNVLWPYEATLANGLTPTTRAAMQMRSLKLTEIESHYCRAWLVVVNSPQTLELELHQAMAYVNSYKQLGYWHVYENTFARVDIYLLRLRG